MKLVCEKNKLEEAILIVGKGVSARSPLPILSHLLFNCKEKKLKIASTDLELGIEYEIPVESEESGAFTAPARTISDIISSLAPGDVILELKENQLIITSHGSEFKLSTLSPEEFPILPRPEGLPVLKVDSQTLKEMLKLVLFSAAPQDETRAILTGILFSLNENLLTMVATDGRRLAKIERTINQLFPQSSQTVVPARSLAELQKLLASNKEVEIAFGEGQIFFTSDGLFLLSRVLEGQFPDYQGLIRKDYPSRAIIERNTFLNVIKRAMITAQERQNPGMIKFQFSKDKLEVTSNTPDLGQAKDELGVELEGEELTIAFNGRYFLEVLGNLTCEKVILVMRDAQTSATLSPTDDENYLYLVMPIRIREEVYS